MTFTQFMFPNGEQQPITIKMGGDVEALAALLTGAGWRFEIECHPETRFVYMDCCDDDEQLADEMVRNGPGIHEAVEALVLTAHMEWIKRGRPRANARKQQEG